MDHRKEQEYALLPVDDHHDSKHSLVGGAARQYASLSKRTVILGASLLAFSVTLNVILVILYFGAKDYTSYDAPSRYAGLFYDNPTVFNWTSDYGPSSTNHTRQDELWEAYAISPGMIALTDEFARSKKLRTSQRFPWDQSRGIYLINGYHKLHCLKKIRRWIMATERGSNRIDRLEHIQHCLDSLRQDILCEADDTPLYSTPGPDKNVGMDEVRQCRSWSKLEAWARSRSACFGYINETGDESGGIQYYRYCPRGSPFASTMRKYFGYGDDYFAEPIERVPPY
ncbi:hypothetical protein VTN02DRAFT_1965 [Thermoascus thermophilus]